MSHTIHQKDKFLIKLKDYFDNLSFDVNGKTLCVCYSGGADSTALLKAMIELSDLYSFNVSACHFNHLIRGDEAYRDEYACKEFCNKNNIKLYCGRDDVPSYAKLNKLSLEEAARDCRYSFFSRILEKNDVDFCVTAHNMNDDAETLIFNILRGAGINGSSAISPYNEHFLRPMLKISREEIISYLELTDTEFVTDSTNLSNDYTRNFIRNIIFKDFEKINPSFIQNLSKYIQSCRDDREYFEEIVTKSIEDDLRMLHKSLRVRIIVEKFKQFSGQHLNYDLINTIDSSIFNEYRTVIPVFDEYEAVICNGKVSYFLKVPFDNKNEEASISFGNNALWNDSLSIEISDSKSDKTENFNNLSITQQLSFDNIHGSLYARVRRTGDRITIKGINKSLKKLFIDSKVPKEYREMIPVICDEEGILYVPFVGIADRAFPANSTHKKYLTVTFNTIDKERWSTTYEK